MSAIARITALCLVLSASFGATQADDRKIILVTPSGVYESTTVDGVPSAWVPLNADVIVQGFGGGGNPAPNPPKPEPPASDPIVQQVATVSKALSNRDEAMACAALVDALARNGLTGDDFQQALTMGAKIADTSLQANGRISAWANKATAITSDPEKLKAGLSSAWGLSASNLLAIQHAVENTGSAPTGAALDFAAIIAILKMVLELLEQLGIL